MTSEIQDICQQPLVASEEGMLRPVPFEDREALAGLWERIVGMFKLAFANPMELFERMPVTEGLAAPWRFYLLMSIPSLLLAGLILLLVATIGFGVLAASAKEGSLALLSGIGLGVVVLLLGLTPLFIFLGMVISGAITHACLWIWGGTKQGVGVGQTIRADGYTNGIMSLLLMPLQILSMIPFLGILFSMASMAGVVTVLVFKGMGLARMHRTDTWRGLVAVFTPLILLCCCGILAAISIPFILASRLH